MFKLLSSIFRRLITGISTPFRMLIVKIQRALNINVISAKLIQPITKNVKKFLKGKPSEKTEYFSVGKFLVSKEFVIAVVIALCAGVFIYFSVFAAKIETAPTALSEIKTDVTFDYDDMGVREFSGIANIRSFEGSIVYTGEIDKGACNGVGMLYSKEGALIYQGQFKNNQYSGEGRKFATDGTIQYEGAFSENLYHGAGVLFDEKGKKMYDGEFAKGVYEGAGNIFDEDGALLYAGALKNGKRHGSGIEYYSNGSTLYSGEFFENKFQGTGQLFNEKGQLLYIGPMHDGEVNYRAIVGNTLEEIESTIKETPSIFYSEDGYACFFYEKMKLIITTDSKVKIHEWERENAETKVSDFYYMDTAAIFGLQLTRLRVPQNALTTSWDVVFPNESSSSNSSSSSSSKEESEKSDSSSSSSSSGSSSNSSSSETSKEEYPMVIASDEGSGEGMSEVPASGSSEPDKPEFVDKTKELYFEVDKDVWQSESELDKTKVLVKKIIIIKAGEKPQPKNGKELLNANDAPNIEECAAIDFLRKQEPTLFTNITFEIDKQNKLFQRVWNINYASGIEQDISLDESMTFRYYYADSETGRYNFYSIEI